YQAVFFFGQQPGDFQYLQQLDVGSVNILSPSLEAYDRFLTEEATDYVGTRLHGGIFALQHGRRALIIEVDNRAAEITKDPGLPVFARQDGEGLVRWIGGSQPTSIQLPAAAIALWRNQFGTYAENTTQQTFAMKHGAVTRRSRPFAH